MRKMCETCAYPEATCVCSSINFQPLPFDISILQEPKESKHAKNTARLAKLVTPKINIINSEDSQSLGQLEISIVKETTIVLYPNQKSVPLNNTKLNQLGKIQGLHLIIIDGTWRQAFKIWKENPWLSTLDSYHFEEKSNSQYNIRKNKTSFQLSTIEAIAEFANKTFSIKKQYYMNAQNALVNMWKQYSEKQNL